MRQPDRKSIRRWAVSAMAAAGALLSLQSVFGTARLPLATAAKLADSPADSLAPAQLIVENVTIDITFSLGTLELSRSQVLDWITVSARGVARYYDHFPVPHVRILLTLNQDA